MNEFGFIGAGLIFVRQDAVRGLTTAAGVWLVAAIGAAAGASLPKSPTSTSSAARAPVPAMRSSSRSSSTAAARSPRSRWR